MVGFLSKHYVTAPPSSPFVGGRLRFYTQVAIKTMLKKYLFSEAEKDSVEREIEIQKVRTYVRIRTYVRSGTSPAGPRAHLNLL